MLVKAGKDEWTDFCESTSNGYRPVANISTTSNIVILEFGRVLCLVSLLFFMAYISSRSFYPLALLSSYCCLYTTLP